MVDKNVKMEKTIIRRLLVFVTGYIVLSTKSQKFSAECWRNTFISCQKRNRPMCVQLIILHILVDVM